MTPSEKSPERHFQVLPGKYSAPRTASRSEKIDLSDRVGISYPGNTGRAEIDDLHRTTAIDHDVVRLKVLMDHFQAMESLQSPRSGR